MKMSNNNLVEKLKKDFAFVKGSSIFYSAETESYYIEFSLFGGFSQEFLIDGKSKRFNTYKEYREFLCTKYNEHILAKIGFLAKNILKK